jgi:hypothetical protein
MTLTRFRSYTLVFATAALLASATVSRGQGVEPSPSYQQAHAAQTKSDQSPRWQHLIYSRLQSDPYTPITAKGRLEWLTWNTLGPGHIFGAMVGSAINTGTDSPFEYGPHFDGFAKRFGIDMAGSGVQNTMEISLGSLWHSDPNYYRVPEKPFGGRLKNVVVRTFESRRSDGRFGPSYARFMAIPGSNFLSNTWRADSEADTPHALYRTGEAFGVRMGVNAFDEFWPDIKSRVFHRGN